MAIKNYYAGSNSSLGFYSLCHEIYSGLKYIFIMKGEPQAGKSAFMRKIGLAFMDRGYELEYYHNPLDNYSIDGLIIPKISVGFVNGALLHMDVDYNDQAMVTEINLDQYRNDFYIEDNQVAIAAIKSEIISNIGFAYQALKEAKQIHMLMEEIYLKALDLNKANNVMESLASKIFSLPCRKTTLQTKKIRFFGTLTPCGAVHFIDNITEDISKRFILKGRPSNGKSTLMEKIARDAWNLGFSVEYYPCAFDPTTLDMVIIPELSVAILDGTAPHIIDPYRKADEVIDMFDKCMCKTVEIENEFALNKWNTNYLTKIVYCTNYLSEAKRLQDKLEKHDKIAGF